MKHTVTDVSYPVRGHPRAIWQPRDFHAITLLRFGAVTLKSRQEASSSNSGPFWRLHRYDQPLLIRDQTDRADRHFRPGDLLICPPWSQLWRKLPQSTPHRYLTLILPASVPQGPEQASPCVILRQVADPTSPELAQAFLHQGSLDPSQRFQLLADAAQALALYFQQEPAGKAWQERLSNESLYPVELQRAQAFIETELQRRLTVGEIARHARCSASTLNRVFREHLHRSITQYVLQRRVQRVAEYIIATEASLEEIAERCGFGNRYYLTRIFSRETGNSPAAFRAKNRPD